MRVEKHNLVFKHNIDNWDEALMLGNGIMGCLIYGGKNKLKLSLDRMDLWDNRPAKETTESGFNYPNLVKLVKDGSDSAYLEHNRLFDSIYSNTTPTKLTAGRLEIPVDDINFFKLDIYNAIATVNLKHNEITAFLHFDKDVCVLKSHEKLLFNFHSPKYLQNELNYAAHSQSMLENIFCVSQITYDNEYSIFACEKQSGNDFEYFITVALKNQDNDYCLAAINRLKDFTKQGFDSLYSSHVELWHKFYSCSEICLDNQQLEKEYYLSTYFFGCLSRCDGYPINLQGVWTADNDLPPPWKGDYHHDLNTQMSYSAYIKQNMLPYGNSFNNYIISNFNKFKDFAKQFYHMDGMIMPACSTLECKPLGGWPQYALSPVMTIWCIKYFDDYFNATQDYNFLKQFASPIFKAVSNAIKGLLVEEQGKLYLPLSTSPEINNNNKNSYLTPNSNNDLALLKYLFSINLKYNKLLNQDMKANESMLSKLDDFAVNKNSGFMISKNLEYDSSHRHFSHLMAVYPLKVVQYNNENKQLIKNSVKALERYGCAEWVGFSFVWLANLHAIMGEKDKCVDSLKSFCNALISPNGFHLNGDYKNTGLTKLNYRPFTLESNFGFCDAIANMLLIKVDEVHCLFNGYAGDAQFTNLRSEDGFLVSASQENNIVVSLYIESDVQTTTHLKINGNIIKLNLIIGANKII